MTIVLAFLLNSFVAWLPNVVRDSVELPQKKCEEFPERVCPSCGSGHLIKNGSVHNGKPKHQCKSCAYQFGTDLQSQFHIRFLCLVTLAELELNHARIFQSFKSGDICIPISSMERISWARAKAVRFAADNGDHKR